MKTVGIIGGVGPESTIEYYRFIISGYRERRPDGSYPLILINSIDLKKMLGFVEANQLAELARYLGAEVEKLKTAGADFGLLASNTPHIAFDEIQRHTSLPLISIVRTTCEAAKALGLKTVGIFGTRFSMQGRFYPDVFSTEGIRIAAPDAAEQEYIHGKYMNELLKGIILPETRAGLLKIVDRLIERDGIQGLILGGTELPPILRDAGTRIPFLDTTQIHVKAIVERLLS